MPRLQGQADLGPDRPVPAALGTGPLAEARAAWLALATSTVDPATLDVRYSSTIIARLTSRLAPHPGGHLAWTGSTNRYGTGRISRGGGGDDVVNVARLAWEIHHRRPAGANQVVTQTAACARPACCNPAHLTRRTRAEQIRPRARLTDRDVARVRMGAPLDGSYPATARRCGISATHARRLVRGEGEEPPREPPVNPP